MTLLQHILILKIFNQTHFAALRRKTNIHIQILMSASATPVPLELSV